MDNLITIENANAVVTIDTIAKFAGVEKDSVSKTLFSQKDLFVELGTNLNSLPKRPNGQTDLKSITLNEESAMLLLALMRNTKQVVEFKFNLIKQFSIMRSEFSNAVELRYKADTKQQIEEAVKEAKKMNTYNINGQDFITVGKYRKEIQTEHTNDFIWDALEFNNLSTSVIKPTKYRRLHENAPDYVATTISGQSTPVFLINAIKQSIIKYEEHLSALEVVEEQCG